MYSRGTLEVLLEQRWDVLSPISDGFEIAEQRINMITIYKFLSRIV